MSNFRLFLLLCAVLLLIPAVGKAQLSVSLAAERNIYLLYEDAFFTVNVGNQTDTNLILTNDPKTGRPWVRFLIYDAKGRKVRATRTFTIRQKQVASGGTTNVRVNITPLYSVRAAGEYRIKAVVNLPGVGDFISRELRFYVGKGTEVKSESLNFDGTQRLYTLIKFLDHERAYTYLRVEEPSVNKIYSCVRLGPQVSFTEPELKFDANNGVHVLHSIGVTRYRYTKANKKGKILSREDLDSQGPKPVLWLDERGSVDIAGRVKRTTAAPKREKLSIVQNQKTE